MHNLDSLTDQHFDMPFPEVIFCLKEVQEMKFYLKPGFGYSKVSYSGIIIYPFQRILQGNRGAPEGWFLIKLYSESLLKIEMTWG